MPEAQNRSDSRFSSGVAATFIVVVGVGLCGFIVLLIPDEVFFSEDGGIKALQARQFAAGDWRTHLRPPAEPWAGALWEGGYFPSGPTSAYRLKGEFVLGYPLAFSAITSPFYRLFGYRGLYAVPLLGLLALWIRFHYLTAALRIAPGIRLAGLTLLVFCNPLILYGALYWEHTLAAALFFIAIAETIDDSQGHLWRQAAGGVCLGLTPWFRSECLALVCVVLLLSLIHAHHRLRLTRWAILAGSCAAVIALFVVFNITLYGAPLGLHSFQVIEGFRIGHSLLRGAEFMPSLLGRLILYAPIAAVIPLGLLLLPRHTPPSDRLALRYVATLAAASALAIPLIVPSEGGKEWGPRFMLPCIPVICLMATGLLESFHRADQEVRRLLVSLLILMAGLGGAVINCGFGAAGIVEDYRGRIAPLLRFVRESEPRVVVVGHKAVAEELEALWGPKLLLRITQMEDLEPLALDLRDAGVDRFLFIHADYFGRGAPKTMDPIGTAVSVYANLLGHFGYYYNVYDCSIRSPGG